jgi:hypothetical protein
MKNRPMRLEAAMVREPPVEFNPLAAYTRMDAAMQKTVSQLLHPKPEETAAMLKKLMERKRWTHLETSIILNVGIDRIPKFLDGSFTDGAVVRTIWLLSKLDEEPEFLSNPVYYITWGKSKGLRPKPDPQPKKPKGPPRKKFIVPPIMKPTSPYMYVDWSLTNKDISRLLKVSEHNVSMVRSRLKKVPRRHLLKAFGAVGRIRQVSIIVRGVTRSIEILTEDKTKERMALL